MAVTRNRPAMTAGSRDASSSGMRAASSWLGERGIESPSIKRWHIEISLATLDDHAPATYDDRVDTRFHIDIYAEEWGFFFCHGGRASWIRITDIPFVHGRDDFRLLSQVPSLSEIGAMLRTIENHHQLNFRRKHALVRTNIVGSEGAIRSWVETL